MMQQRGSTTVLHFLIDTGKIVSVLHACGSDGQDSKTPFLKRRRHHPIGIASHQKTNMVRHSDWLFALVLDKMMIAGYKVFQLAFRSVITSPKGLLGM
jgi:hypothetical protein